MVSISETFKVQISLSQTLNSSIIQLYPYLHQKNLKMFNDMITMKVCFRFLLTAIVVIVMEQCRSEFVLVEIDDSDRTSKFCLMM